MRPDILAVETRIERLLRGAAQVIGSDADRQEDRKTDRRQGCQTPSAQQHQTTP